MARIMRMMEMDAALPAGFNIVEMVFKTPESNAI